MTGGLREFLSDVRGTQKMAKSNDLSLLAAVLLSPGTVLWTLDKRLCALAERFGVLHQTQLH